MFFFRTYTFQQNNNNNNNKTIEIFLQKQKNIFDYTYKCVYKNQMNNNTFQTGFRDVTLFFFSRRQLFSPKKPIIRRCR